MLAQMVRQGSITSMARNLGAMRKRMGLMAMVSSASISSLTFMVPNFGGEGRTRASNHHDGVINGPSSRDMETATAVATALIAPNLRSS